MQSPSAPDRLWVQHHNGIFRSDDGSASWREIADVPPSSFGFAVAVHPREPDTAWFVPAIKDERRIPVDGRLVVTRTRDGGETFDVLREGLPQEHAYDLVYRHALAVDQTGDRLAFAPPPAACGSARTRATIGGRSATPFPRRTRCGSCSERVCKTYTTAGDVPTGPTARTTGTRMASPMGKRRAP